MANTITAAQYEQIRVLGSLGLYDSAEAVTDAEILVWAEFLHQRRGDVFDALENLRATALPLVAIEVCYTVSRQLATLAPERAAALIAQAEYLRVSFGQAAVPVAPSGGGGGGADLSQVEALIAAHRAIATAHQTPGLSQQQVTAIIDNALLAYATTTGVTQSIDHHAAIATAHQPEQVNADWNATTGKAQILNKPGIPNVTNANIASAFDGKLLRRVTLTRTFVDQLSATDGDAIISTGNSNGPNGATDFVGIDVDPVSGGSEAALIESARAGDYILVELPNDKILLGCIAGVVALAGSDADVRQVWYRRLYHEGLDAYDSDAHGEGKIYLSEHIQNRSAAELTDLLRGLFALLDGSNLTTQFKNDVRSPQDPYTFAAPYVRLANGATVAADNRFAFNATPTLNGAVVQLDIRFAQADVASAIERWLVGNEIVLGTGTYRLEGTAVQASGRLYTASVKLVAGTVQVIGDNGRPTLQPDTPHRSELADVAFDGRYDSLVSDSGQPADISSGTSRGQHIATYTLPTTAQNNGQLFGSNTLTMAAGVPSGFNKFGSYIEVPIKPPSDDVIGFWFIATVSGNERGALFLPWMVVAFNTDLTYKVPFGPDRFVRAVAQHDTSDYVISVAGDNDTLFTDPKVEICLAVSGRGPKGDTGPAVALSDATPAALGTAAAGTGTAASRDDHVHAAPTQTQWQRAGYLADVTETYQDLATGLNDDDMLCLQTECYYSNESGNVEYNNMWIRFGTLPTSDRWMPIRGAAGGARFMFKRVATGQKIQVRRAGPVSATNWAQCYVVGSATE